MAATREQEYEKTLVVSVETLLQLHGLVPAEWREFSGAAEVSVTVVRVEAPAASP
jgi:hypothetical protein